MKTRITLLFTFVALTNAAWADLTSVGIDGINATATGLDGTGAVIGMVEGGRPGDPDKDLPINYHEQVNPTQVYQGSSIDGANSGFVAGGAGLHATQVAGVMIASNTPNGSLLGVAAKASLHAGADPKTPPDVDFAVTGNRIARISNMRAINVSTGRAYSGLEGPDGNAFPSQFIDWSSENQDVLWVMSASEDSAMVGTPQDSFNGITVGASQTLNAGVAGSFRQAWSENDTISDPSGARTAIDILAPGFDIFVTGQNNQNAEESGTSFAAPHVTGTVALLEQYGISQADAPVSNPRFIDRNYEQHEVLKALLLNSADKLDEVHGSGREIVNQPAFGAQKWTVTTAFLSPFTPLDINMGAGHMNAMNAITNLTPGEYAFNEMVPPIGWDFGDIGSTGQVRDYVIDQPVDGYVAVTLAWDRRVDKTGETTTDTISETSSSMNHLAIS